MVAADMPEAAADPFEWRQAAIDALDRFLAGHGGASTLSASELKRYPERNLTHGWRTPSPDAGPLSIDLLIDQNFPYSAPRIALSDGPGPLVWPHVESDGVLCVLPSQATVSTRDPVAVAKYILADALKLIEFCSTGTISNDLRDEFLSYWGIASDEGTTPFVSLVEPRPPTRKITTWHGESAHVCADNRATLDGWLERRGTKRPEEGFTHHQGMLLWLPQPMVPDEYPRTAADVRSLVANQTPETGAVLEECVASNPISLDVIIGAPTAHGACFAAVRVRRPDRKELTRGFRPGRVPAALSIDRYLGAGKVIRSEARRADHNWVHGRDQDLRQCTLKERHVLILGCGAVGGGVARLLAQCGVARLTLVDPQSLDWPNVSRHALGSRSIRRNKAIEMAEGLRRDFPHLDGVEGHGIAFGLAATSLIDELPTFDLVIGATGDWSVDALLNDLQKSRLEIPQVLYAWLEPHAAAAHALLIPQAAEGACLRCGFNDVGVPAMPVTSWPDGEQLLQEPACGAEFSPFGSVELAWGNALVADLALSALLERMSGPTCHTWINRRSTVEDAGGQWNPVWCDRVSDPGQGGVVVQRNWPRSPGCPDCSKVAAA